MQGAKIIKEVCNPCVIQRNKKVHNRLWFYAVVFIIAGNHRL